MFYGMKLVQAWIVMHEEEKMFNTVTPFIGTIQWENLADLCPDTVYLDSVKIVNKTAKGN